MKQMASDLSEEFPIWGLVPKKETGVLNFLTKYPNFDGRDIVIAILDSGVDPAAIGLSATSTGKRKIIERFDCSGAGDVNISTVVTDTTGVIQGLSGRNLKIPSTWNNPTKEYHIGIKNAYSLYPDKLRERIEEDNKDKHWNPSYQSALAEATRKLQEFESKHANTILSPKDKLDKEDLEARIDVLTNSDKKYHDLGPTYDCVVFFDCGIWWACIDTSDNGDLGQVQLLGEFSKTNGYRYLTEEDQFTISINIHNNGNTLEIVGMCSPHGTHVASITSAYFPNNPEKNGVAPGAQIISLTIGDARLQSMETGTAIVRAIIKLMELSKKYPVKVVNMSYGEHAHWANSGRIGELMNEVVNKYGIIWVASAGNHGPALCTVGSPPDISQPTIIGVGAYVSPEMMIAEYALRQKLPGMPFTWSSCGPTMDGHNGVSICAPGAAITSVSMYTLRSAQLMNGTSMSSPHVAGAVAVLLSGLKQMVIPYSPYSVKRTLENTAMEIGDTEKFAQGYGLLQVDRAFEWLVKYDKCPCRDIRLDVLVNGTDKGILIRNGLTDRHRDFNIVITPFFLDNSTITPAIKTAFNIRLALTSSNSCCQHIKFPSYLDLANMQRAFSIQVDPSGLKPGVYYTTINGYDVTCIEKGPLLRIPVTIIKPIKLLDPIFQPQLDWRDQSFVPNTIRRIFVKVPEQATWATLRFQADDKSKLERFVIHTMQIQPKLSCKVLESQRYWNIGALNENIHNFKVKGGLILEVTIAKYWASIGDVSLNYTLTFQGVKPNNSSIIMHGADGVHMLQLRTMRNEEILPVITLKNTVHPLRPSESKINVLTNRDIILPERQIYELVLTYSFHVSKQTEVLPNCGTLSDMLYESEFESQLWFIYDSNKQLVAVGDAYPSKYTPKLEKGDYTLKLQIRHDKKDLLESYTDLPISIAQKLANSIVLDVYSTKTLALVHGKKISATTCPPGQIYPIYINALSAEKTSKIPNCGQYLSGVITFAKDESGKKVDTYSFRYILPESTKKSNGKPVDKDKTKHDEYLDALRDLRVSWLVKLEGSSEAYELFAQMKKEHNNHCTIHTAMLQSIDAFDTKRQAPTLPVTSELTSEELKLFDEIESICNELIDSIDQSKLLAYNGIKSDTRPDAAKIKTEMDRQKTAIVEAFARKGIIYCKRYFTALPDEKTNILDTNIKKIWDDILKYVEPTDSKVIFFSMWHATVLGHYGRLLKYMFKYGEDKPSKELDQKAILVLETLNWSHGVRSVRRSIPTKFPPSYSIF